MGFELVLFGSGLIQKQAVNVIIKCNWVSWRFGLVLTQAQAADLVETRTVALSHTGRIEFGGGVIDKIINEFCDSPYLSMHNDAAVLHELVEIFLLSICVYNHYLNLYASEIPEAYKTTQV